MDWFARFRQAGKMGCDLYGSAQDYMDVTSSLRRMVDNWYFCTKKHFLGINIDFRGEAFDHKIGRSIWKGFHFALPMVYPALRVRRSFFTSMSAKNRYNSILGTSTMYPSTLRRISRCYDHEKMVTESAMGKLHIFGKKGKYVKKGGGAIETLNGTPENASLLKPTPAASLPAVVVDYTVKPQTVDFSIQSKVVG
jgi:hypothetical protein